MMPSAVRSALSTAVAAGMLAATALLPRDAAAQFYFGQNQVQYDKFDWRVIETEHFLVHYYPEIETVAQDAARMAERSYARLSRLMGHEFREKKPILLYGSSGDFAQSNVFGDLGEGTGGVTDFARQRMAQFFPGDYASFEHVFQHEMVHVFQYDVFSRGRAGANVGAIIQVQPPLWFMEGLAEYLSIGPEHAWTSTWVRDAVVNGSLPSIQQMTERPDLYFPYRYGLSVWQYVGSRWGDQAIAEIMNATPSIGIDRAFRREIGMGLEELSNAWQDAMRAQWLPLIPSYDRPRTFAEPLLTQRTTGGLANYFVAPALSPDASLISFVSYGSLNKGEVFPDLYLADAKTGERITRLVNSTTNPDFEQLRFIYSQPNFSPDGRLLAFTGQRQGKDVLYIMDVRRRKVIRRIDAPVEQVLNPSFSPDGSQIVFTGLGNGVTDLYVVPTSGGPLRRLTRDKFGDAHPQWSPDGRTIAFASDRGPETDFEILRFGKYRISLLDVETGRVTVLPGQDGININPQWSPDGRSLIFVSDRTGTANLFLYELDSERHYQLTNVIGAVTAVAEYSPAITWAREADVLAFVYYEKSDHTVWRIENPRSLKRAPFPTGLVAVGDSVPAGAPAADSARRDSVERRAVRRAIAALPLARTSDTAQTSASYYVPPLDGARRSEVRPELPFGVGAAASVAALLDSADFALPDTSELSEYKYKARLQPEFIAQPQVGAQVGGFSQGLVGGTTIVLGDLMGDHRLAIAAGINGQLNDAQLFVGYTNLKRRLQYTTGVAQQPFYLLQGVSLVPVDDGTFQQSQSIVRIVQRQAFVTGMYPLSRFTRFEFGAAYANVDYQQFDISRFVDGFSGFVTPFQRGETRNLLSVNTVSPNVAFVNDNSLFGLMGPISGRRMRFEVRPQFGTWQWTDYLVDARHYYPVLFNKITLASRFLGSLTVGRDEDVFPKWLGRPDLLRGYGRNDIGFACGAVAGGFACNDDEAVGSRVMLFSSELRFPIIRLLGAGGGVGLPPLDGLLFYDAGVAWSQGQELVLSRPSDYDFTRQRALLQSYGWGLRLNLFGLMMVRYDYAYPINRPNSRGFGTWWFGMSY